MGVHTCGPDQRHGVLPFLESCFYGIVVVFRMARGESVFADGVLVLLVVPEIIVDVVVELYGPDGARVGGVGWIDEYGVGPV